MMRKREWGLNGIDGVSRERRKQRFRLEERLRGSHLEERDNRSYCVQLHGAGVATVAAFRKLREDTTPPRDTNYAIKMSKCARSRNYLL